MILLKRCVIITAYQSALLTDSYDFCTDDYIICADGGFTHAVSSGIKPDVLIGDFDSLDFVPERSDMSDTMKVIRLSSEKDDTDTLSCLKYGIEKGFQEFVILGGLGGRLDHTLANLQTMSYALDSEKSICIIDGKNRATLKNPGSYRIKKLENYKISLFAFVDSCVGVCIRGVKYPLKDALLVNSFPIGISNEFLDEYAEISHSSGKLLIVLSKD